MTSRKTTVVRQRRPEVNDLPRVIEHPPLSPGFHIAPFLHGYAAGGFAILAIDADGALAGLFGIEAGHAQLEIDVYTGRGPVEPYQNIDVDDTALFSDMSDVREIAGGSFWQPGVHRAPWKPRFLRDGIVLVGIARNSHMWGMHEAPKVTAELLHSFGRILAAADEEGSGGLRPSIINYAETDSLEAGEHRRLLQIESQYAQDRAEYGRLIGLAAHEDNDDDRAE